MTNSAFTVEMRDNGGYSATAKGATWRFDGVLPAGFHVSAAASGTDRIGPYHAQTAQDASGRSVSIRVYDAKPLVLFVDRRGQGSSNDFAFPTFKALPVDATQYSFLRDSFAHYEFNKLGEEGPWILFKEKHAVVLSPADHFKISIMNVDAQGHASSGINAKITTLPQGFEHATLLAAGDGVDAAMETWGAALEALGGKKAVPNDADPMLTKFGYWTDNGASYYYRHEDTLSYEDTLLAVKDSFAKLGIPLGYLQLDSWFYPKGQSATEDKTGKDLGYGEQVYRADPKLFPDGLAAFHRRLGLPLVTHARWISTTSPYRQQYAMSGNVILDPKFWNETAAYLKQSGVITYEQDWLNANASTEMTLSAPSAFLDTMAASMKAQGLTMQYCMAPPSDYMATTEFENLTTIRTSDDRFNREEWDAFLYDSRMATALGAQPWVDVFMSRELGNLLVATLSGGPVGVGDALGETNADNLHAALRGDGVIVKPDVGLRPIERMYEQDAAGSEQPMVAVAASRFADGSGAQYVFAYPRREQDQSATVSLGELGLAGPAVAYDWVKHTAKFIQAGGEVALPFDGASADTAAAKPNYETLPEKDAWNLTIVAPLPSNKSAQGIAMLGDANQFAMLGRKRVRELRVHGNITSITVDFAPGEQTRTLIGYAKHAPKLHVETGSGRLLQYDQGTGLFSVGVAPGRGSEASFSIE